MSEKLEFNQIDQQLANSQTASLLVERKDGAIQVGQVLGYGEHGSIAYLANLNNKDATGDLSWKRVSSEQLSDRHQQELAEGLAGAALRETVSAVPHTEKFDPEKANLERAIRDAMAEKARAQKEGRGDDSIYWGQQAGRYTKELGNL